MKSQPTLLNSPCAKGTCRFVATVLLALLPAAACLLTVPASAATSPPHGIIAANLDVVINSFDNDTNAVTVTTPYRIGDFRVPYGNNGDYDIQIGTDRTDDVPGGVLISSVRENGRDDGHPLFPGLQLCTPHIDYHRAPSTGPSGETIDNSYWIPIAGTRPSSLGTSVAEWDINIAAGWFPYDKWLGGFARNVSGANGGVHDLFTGSPSLVLGTHYVDLGSGRARVDLTSLGIDARTDGVLLVMGAKNEDNYGLSQVNAANGTWNLFSKDNGTDTTSLEQDPFAFVFIPKSDTNVVSGRFLGNGTISMFSGNSPQFTITNTGVGTWELKIPGKSPRFGVLLLSPEGGLTGNQDNIVTYQVNNAGDGWIIQSWDLPAPVNGTGWDAPPLETPGDGTEPVADFVFIPGATPGFTVTPTKNLYTTESGGTAEFTVVLDTAPMADVTINVSSDNTAEGTVSASSLTFTPANWDQPQTVTVTGQDDATEDGPVTYHVILSASTSTDADFNGLNPVDPTVVNLDNEAAFTVLPVGGLTTTEAGGTATFDVILNMAPTADVTIGLSSSDTTEGTVSPSSLTFTTGNWNQAQTVTVTGVNDSQDDGDVAYSIVTAAAVSTDANFSGKNPPDVGVVNLDDDTAGVNVSAAGLGVVTDVVEGKTSTYTVVLDSQPTADVTVTLVSSDTAQGGTVSPPSLSFNAGNWSNPQLVTLTGANDLVADGDSSWYVTNTITSADASYAATAPISVSVKTLDDEPALTLPSGEVFYGAGTPAIGIDGRAQLSDPNAGSYNGVKLTVGSTAGGTADDRIEIRNTGNGAGQVGVSGSTVSYGGTAVGTFAGGSGTTALVVTFNSSATPASAQAVLRSVTFRNVNSTPSVATRTVMVTIAHTDSGQSSAVTSVRVGPFRVADFQEGADHGYGIYTGQADIELFEDIADVAFPAGHSGTTNDPRMWLDARDAGTTGEAQALMRFDNIVGNGPGQIPPGATIVSAELFLTVVDTGHGSPLFRMKVPWSEQSETWLSFGNGIQIDDVEANSALYSQFSVQTAVTTGTGQFNIGVTDDVQAWVNGEPNYGWGLVTWDPDLNGSWTRGNNGTAIRPSEAPTIDERPRLRVIWVPTNTVSASFRQNVDGYTSAHDTRLREDSPDTEASTLTSVFIDFAGSHDVPLLRFDDIIGDGPGQIPLGSHVNAAILDLASIVGNAPGDGGQFFVMLQPWDDTDTWNSRINGIQTDGVEASTTANTVAGSPALAPNVCGGYMSFEVTTDVQAWVSGALPNYGWAVVPWNGGGDGWAIGTAESADERARPRLRVYFTAGVPSIVLQTPTVSPSSVQFNFSGAANDSYYILRAPAVTGPWSTNGVANTDATGKGSHTDGTPLPGGAFYRAFHP